VETEDDLETLFLDIERINDGFPVQQQLVITPFFVVAGPDFAAMRDSGCPGKPSCAYRELWWHNSSGGLSRPPFNRGDLRAAYKSGLRRRLWHPEYHGRSHFDSNAWEAYLREGDATTSSYFEANLTYYAYGKAYDEGGGRRGYHSTHSEYVSDDSRFTKSSRELREWAEGGLSAFKEFWGYAPSVTAAPCHYISPDHGYILGDLGIQSVEAAAGGRGLVNGLPGVERIFMDPGFSARHEWEREEEKAWTDIERSLDEMDHVLIQVMRHSTAQHSTAQHTVPPCCWALVPSLLFGGLGFRF
jgi:hypothetical protein